MSDDELEYLTPGFDASSLTVPRIRSILVSHDVPYPASAKKSQLIQTFNEQITPRAPRMLASRNRTKRTSKGITDMPSSQESTVDGDDQDDADAMPPPPTPSTARRRTNKGTRPSAESSADIRPAAPKAKSPHKRTSKHPRASDSEAGAEAEDVRPTARKTQRSEGPPAVKVEESELTGLNPRARPEESPFSDDNPFQSGSSPMPATEPRRRTTGMKTDKKRVSSGRRKTERPTSIKHEDDVVVPSSRTFEVPINRVKAMSKSEPEDPLEAGEEFTPEEQQALAQDHTAQGRADAHVARRRKPKSTSSALKSAPWVILTTLLAGYAAWWRKEKIEVGFCGVGKPAGILTEIQIPDWASSLQPQCEPCPLHGSCYSDMTVRCDLDFILKSHPLSLGGLVPLPPTCEPDGEKARKVKAVTDRAVEELRDRRAKWECGELTDKTGKTATSPEIDEVKLKAEVGRKRRKAMNDFEFEELWRSALGEIQAREEVTSNVDGITRLARLSSSSLAKLPLGCAVRRSARLALARYRGPIILLAAVAALVAYLRNLLLSRRADRARVPALVGSTLDRLATQAARHTQGTATEPWISAGQLRDDVLRDEFSAVRREKIWAQVRAIVERNANVRASVREGRAGEVSRVWEWIGSVQDLADWRSANGGGQLGRRSLSPAKESFQEADVGAGAEMVEKRRWDEGRPIY